MKKTFITKWKQLTVISVCAGVMSVSLESCGSMSDSSLTLLQGTGLGAAGGAAVGAGVGALAGNSQNRGQAILIGGIAGSVLGGVIGHAWAKSVVKKKAEYASQEEWIKANTKQLDARIADARKLNNSLRDQINTLKKQNASISKSDFTSVKNSVNQKITYLNTDIDTTKANLKGVNSSGQDVQKLRQKLAELQNERQMLLTSVAELGKRSARA